MLGLGRFALQSRPEPALQLHPRAHAEPSSVGNGHRAQQIFLGSLVRYSVGGLLLAAVALKGDQFVTDPPLTTGGLARALSYLGMACEVVCGCALVFGFAPRTSRLASLALFSVLLAVSGFHLAVGSRSCGCLGNVDLGPAAMALVDLIALAALWYWRPAERTKTTSRIALPLSVLLCVGLVSSALWLAPPRVPLQVEVLPALVDLGTMAPGEQRPFEVALHNTTGETVIIDRFEFSCSCLTSNETTVLLAPFGEATVQFDVDLAKDPLFRGELLLSVNGFNNSGELTFVVRVALRVSALSDSRATKRPRTIGSA